MWIVNSLFGNPSAGGEQLQAHENEDVLYSQNEVYLPPKLTKSHIEPPPISSPEVIETIFSRSRQTFGSSEVNIVDLSSNPLPIPPRGMYWENNNGEWRCISTQTASSLLDKDTTNFVENGEHYNTDEHVWIEHVVMPDDTLRGICLKYRCSVIELRRCNNFSGDAFRSRKSLSIKVSRKHIDNGDILVQDKSLVEVKVQELKSRIHEPSEECVYYLKENDYNVDKAFNAWEEDEKFNNVHSPPTNASDNDTYDMNVNMSHSKRNESKMSVSKTKKDL